MTTRTSHLIAFALFTLLAAQASLADASDEYHRTFEQADARFDAALSSLKSYQIVLVPGFLSDVIIDLGPYGLKATRLGEYYDTQITWLRSAAVGLDVVRIDKETFAAWNSENSVSQNAEVIAEAVRKSEKPVLIISHSKGGLDTLEMFRKHPELRARVAGWVALQSPFLGSPIADCVSQRSGLSFVAFELLEKLGGNRNSLLDLKTDVRTSYMSEHALEIAEVTRTVPSLSVASVKVDEPYRWDTLLEFFRDEMDTKGLENDGLVPLAFTELPGADHVTIRHHEGAEFGIDHAVTVMECAFISFDRVRFMKTLLAMLQDRITNR